MRNLVRKLDIIFNSSPAREERIRQSRGNLLEDINGTLIYVPTTITGHFGFVFEENAGREITGLS